MYLATFCCLFKWRLHQELTVATAILSPAIVISESEPSSLLALKNSKTPRHRDIANIFRMLFPPGMCSYICVTLSVAVL